MTDDPNLNPLVENSSASISEVLEDGFDFSIGSSAPSHLKGTETVLLVEDEEAVRRILVKTLEQKGYKVIEASNGMEALKKIEGCGVSINLLLTDIVMPKMCGMELSDQLLKTKPDLKILFISGYPAEVLAEQGIVIPDIQMLSKPFSTDQLMWKIREMLGQKAS